MEGVSQMFHGTAGGRGLRDEATASLPSEQPRPLATQIAAAVARFFGVRVAKKWMATRFDSRGGAALIAASFELDRSKFPSQNRVSKRFPLDARLIVPTL
jgi:hypothetical protein